MTQIEGEARRMCAASRKKFLHGTHRLRGPAQTLEQVRPHLDRMGITRIANLTGLDRIGLPVVMAARPNSRSVAVSLGKGLTLAAAQASAVMEAAESWHAERIRLPQRSARAADLAEEGMVADTARLPRVGGGSFDPDRAMLWTRAQELNSGAPCWVPSEMLDTDYTGPPAGGQGAFPRSTNGLASGNGYLEAACHAICELVERDAATLWHQAPPGPRLDPATVSDEACAGVLARLAAAGVETGIWDMTTDTGIACFHCALCEAGGQPGHIGIGDGCHPDRGIALLRALSEAAQTRLTYVSGARDDLDPADFTGAEMARRAAYVRGLIRGTQATAPFQDVPTLHSAAFEEDMDWLLARLQAAGFGQVMAADLSRPEIGIAVVRAVVPGLEAPHDDPDFLPGARAARAGAA
ncbi:YcaO-like family protein [Cribrihabitans pelagius]|uniref:YcaO-like family protein n=1 Tax=Cribrihabitans pelagius TaxID=1765746 RepID=UPI003B5B30C0